MKCYDNEIKEYKEEMSNLDGVDRVWDGCLKQEMLKMSLKDDGKLPK